MITYVVECIAITGLDQNFQKDPLALPYSHIDHISGTNKRRLFPEELAKIVHKYHAKSYRGKDACKVMNVFFAETLEDGLQTFNWDWFDGISVQYSDNHDKKYTITWKMFEKALLGVREVTVQSERRKK